MVFFERHFGIELYVLVIFCCCLHQSFYFVLCMCWRFRRDAFFFVLFHCGGARVAESIGFDFFVCLFCFSVSLMVVVEKREAE